MLYSPIMATEGFVLWSGHGLSVQVFQKLFHQLWCLPEFHLCLVLRGRGHTSGSFNCSVSLFVNKPLKNSFLPWHLQSTGQLLLRIAAYCGLGKSWHEVALLSKWRRVSKQQQVFNFLTLFLYIKECVI